ncbi:hypothetical protein [Clostridium sp.]|uniref:hypothetical protein n=1 Tax=Clostridium sp. TaxID=1506 RepID=UPI002FC6F80D
MNNKQMIIEKMENKFNNNFKSIYNDNFKNMYDEINREINVKIYEECINNSKNEDDLNFYMDCLSDDYIGSDNTIEFYINRYQNTSFNYLNEIAAFLPIKEVSAGEIAIVFKSLDGVSLFNERVETFRVLNKSKVEHIMNLIREKKN